jgi:hypothetical protein
MIITSGDLSININEKSKILYILDEKKSEFYLHFFDYQDGTSPTFSYSTKSDLLDVILSIEKQGFFILKTHNEKNIEIGFNYHESFIIEIGEKLFNYNGNKIFIDTNANDIIAKIENINTNCCTLNFEKSIIVFPKNVPLKIITNEDNLVFFGVSISFYSLDSEYNTVLSIDLFDSNSFINILKKIQEILPSFIYLHSNNNHLGFNYNKEIKLSLEIADLNESFFCYQDLSEPDYVFFNKEEIIKKINETLLSIKINNFK